MIHLVPAAARALMIPRVPAATMALMIHRIPAAASALMIHCVIAGTRGADEAPCRPTHGCKGADDTSALVFPRVPAAAMARLIPRVPAAARALMLICYNGVCHIWL